MRKEYWAATWIKINCSVIALTLFLGIACIAKGFYISNIELVILGVLIAIFGMFFLIHAIAVIKWPVFVTEDDCIYYRGMFGFLYVYKLLEKYQVQRVNQGIYLYDRKKHILRTGFISRKKDDELYEYISRYCKPLPES